jgi:hypothetical protein
MAIADIDDATREMKTYIDSVMVLTIIKVLGDGDAQLWNLFVTFFKQANTSPVCEMFYGKS